MKIKLLLSLSIFAMAFHAHAKEMVPAPATKSEQLTIVWEDPSVYKDIDGEQYKNRKDQLKVINSLANSFIKINKRSLPDHWNLTLEVNDVDLAGQLQPALNRATGNYLRVVKQGFPASMKFSYVLKNASGEVVSQGDVKIRQNIERFTMGNEPYSYLTTGFKRWLRSTVKG